VEHHIHWQVDNHLLEAVVDNQMVKLHSLLALADSLVGLAGKQPAEVKSQHTIEF